MKFNIFFVLTFGLICFSCSKVRPGEHGCLAFENNSSDTVYVDGGILDEKLVDYQSKKWSIGIPKKSCEVAPGSINYETCGIAGCGVAYSYECVFVRAKTPSERCLVYVVPFPSTIELGIDKPLYNFKLVCYELTFEDLVSLDFHLYYPPNEKMKNVKMDPPYESFVNKTN